MATPQVETPIDLATVERLSERFAEVFQTLDAGEDVFHAAEAPIIRP